MVGEPGEVWLNDMRFEYNHEEGPAVTELRYFYAIAAIGGAAAGVRSAVLGKFHYVGQRSTSSSINAGSLRSDSFIGMNAL